MGEFYDADQFEHHFEKLRTRFAEWKGWHDEDEPIRWYLAGSIGPADWRGVCVEGLRETSAGMGTEWPVLAGAVLGISSWHYIGPYYMRPLPTTLRVEAREGGVAHGMRDPQGHGCFHFEEVRDRCTDAIDRCDIVLAWIDKPDCYGTLVEIGWAAAKGKRIVFASTGWPSWGHRGNDWLSEMWLAQYLSTENIGPDYQDPSFGSPREALLAFRALQRTRAAARRVDLMKPCEPEARVPMPPEPPPMVVVPEVLPTRLDPQRLFSPAQKKEIYLRCNGHCQACAQPLGVDWHADHIVPHSRGGRTEVINGQSLCQSCNSRKRAKVLTVDEG